MRKEVKNNVITFYDNDDNVLIEMKYIGADLAWVFYSNDVIKVNKDDELYKPLDYILKQEYEFSKDEELLCTQTDDEIKWYSDCAYNPDNEFERNYVSYLNISKKDEIIELKCTKPIDKIVERKDEKHIIAFGPLGNGRYSRNIDNNKTLQDEIVLNVYNPLLSDQNSKYEHLKEDVKFKFQLGTVLTFTKINYKEKLFNYYLEVYSNEDLIGYRNLDCLSSLVLILESQDTDIVKSSKINELFLEVDDNEKLKFTVEVIRNYIIKGEKIDNLLYTDIIDNKEEYDIKQITK